ncbi:MAG: DNA gyrase modulator, partial [Bacteroidota bacterium]
MKRRDFIQIAGLGAGAAMLPIPMMGKSVPLEALLADGIDVRQKKVLSDVGLNAAKSAGASYADVRIGRYLNQYVFTREDKVQNVVNTESFGVGVRVIADGTWGFSSTIDVTPDGIKKAAEIAVQIAKANSKIQKEPVQLAPVKAHGEVSWKTPIKRNAIEVPISEKADLLLSANAAAMEKGANYVNSAIFQVNEQKYFASTEGSYIDQDVHRIWPFMQVTAIDPKAGKFKSRQGLSAPMGLGYEYMDPDPNEMFEGPGGVKMFRNRYDIIADATDAALQAKEMLSENTKSVEPGKYDLVL